MSPTGRISLGCPSHRDSDNFKLNVTVTGTGSPSHGEPAPGPLAVALRVRVRLTGTATSGRLALAPGPSGPVGSPEATLRRPGPSTSKFKLSAATRTQEWLSPHSESLLRLVVWLGQ
jgi:hypothetical protein